MEWTRESLRGTYILVKSRMHAKRIIKFYESFGFQNKITKTPEIGWYICAVDFTSQDGILLVDVICYKRTKGMKEIALQTKPRRKFPREMMVSNGDGNWKKRIVVAKIKNKHPFIALKTGYNIQDLGNTYCEFIQWEHAKEIEEDNSEKLDLFS